MGRFTERIHYFFHSRWLVFVAAMWMQSWAGTGYLFGSISPVIKSALNYNQRQVSSLGVAKDLGGSIGLSAGSLSEILPLWGALLVGVMQNFVGYGWIWLIVTGRAPALPLWPMCILIFVGANGETYFNTAALVSCVQNFPKNRGPVVGILKGFAGLSGAILTQLYTLVHSPDHASLILMVVVGPTIVIIALMFIVRPVGGQSQIRSSDGFNFSIIYSICLLLAAYLMGLMLVQDLVDLSETVITISTVILLVILFAPIVIPVTSSFQREPRLPVEESLLPEPLCGSEDNVQDIISTEIEAEKEDVESPSPLERQRLIAQRQADLSEASAHGVERINKQKLQMGEDCTLSEALTKVDFWLIFCSLLLGSGSGLTVIDNLGQMSQSLGYDNTDIFVSMISIWNFLGRVGGGYVSEKIVSDYAYPRPAAMAGAQVIMAVGHFFFAMGWSGAMYVGTLLVGLGYGAHWAVVPAGASELFGLKSFGSLYNFLSLANPMGSLVFSGIIASSLYDREAERQAHEHSLMSSFDDEPLKCNGAICFFLSSLIMSGFCICAVVLSMVLVYRTKMVYASLYRRSQQLTLDKT